MLLSLEVTVSSCSMYCMVCCDSAKCVDSFALQALPVCARLFGSHPEMHLSVHAASGLLSTLRSAPEQQSFTGKRQDCTPRCIWDAGACPVEAVVIPLHPKVALGKLKLLLEEHISAADGQ